MSADLIVCLVAVGVVWILTELSDAAERKSEALRMAREKRSVLDSLGARAARELGEGS